MKHILLILLLSLGTWACGEEETTASESVTATQVSSKSKPDEGSTKKAIPVPTEANAVDTLNAWCASQTRGGFESYKTFYHEDFKGVRRTSKGKAKRFDQQGWFNDREPGFDMPLKVDCRAPKVSLKEGNTEASIIFEQYFRSPTYADQGQKEIGLRWFGDKWLLVYEDMLNAKKWNRKAYMDGTTAEPGPTKVKVGKLRIKKLWTYMRNYKKPIDLYRIGGKYGDEETDTGRKACLRILGCGVKKAGNIITGLNVKASTKASGDIAFFRYRLLMTNKRKGQIEDGTLETDFRALRTVARGKVESEKLTFDITLDEPRKMECGLKLILTAYDVEGVPLAKGYVKGSEDCYWFDAQDPACQDAE